ncbi:MAG: RNA pseudouridine synthase [Polyangiales bacterium]
MMHRLDTDTSGVVLVARNAETFDALRLATREEKISKRYLALVEGVVAGEGTVEHPLVPHRKDPKRVEAVTEHVRLRAGTRTHPALTRYRVARAFDGFTLLEVELHAGYRHRCACTSRASGTRSSATRSTAAPTCPWSSRCLCRGTSSTRAR